jgi:hypothetical protein
VLALCASVAAPEDARGEEPPSVSFELSCRPEAAIGRVLCEARYRVEPGVRLAWADALVTHAPEQSRPLRARVAPERFKESSVTERKVTLAFVASATGVGEVRVRARAVACRGSGDDESCVPSSKELRAEVRVGR